MGTSSFAASHISHQDANQHYRHVHPPDLAPAASRPPPGTAKHLSASPKTAIQAGVENGDLGQLHPTRQAKILEHSMPQDNRDSKPRTSDTAGGTDRKVGASVSPQESCAQADATAAEPVPTAARKMGLNRLSKAFQAKRARNMENTALPTAVPQAGVPGLQDVAQDCGSAPKKQLAWSKGSAKTAFNASDLDPVMKEVASGSRTIHMKAFRSKFPLQAGTDMPMESMPFKQCGSLKR